MAMIKLRKSRESELALFAEMETQAHARRFVHSTDRAGHWENFSSNRIVYLSIVDESEVVVGFFILVNDTESAQVEFRRIVVDQNHRGVGQRAILEMEKFCRSDLFARRIWLDVYEDNKVGKHIYEKLGYKQFRQSLCEGRRLLFYRKHL